MGLPRAKKIYKDDFEMCKPVKFALVLNRSRLRNPKRLV